MNATNKKMSFVRGFTIVELVFVVAVIAILAAIAVPAYGRYVLRSQRIEAKTMLNFAMQAQERFFSTYNFYNPVLVGAQPGGLNLTGTCGGLIGSENCHYLLTAEAVDGNQNVILIATPDGRQEDDVCGELRLSAAGAKLPLPDPVVHTNGDCW